MKCPLCHYVIISDIQAQVAIDIPEGTIIVHEYLCAKLIRREMERKSILEVLKKLSAACLILFSLSLYAEEIREEKEWVWGCQIRGRTLAGDCAMRRFTKIGEADNEVDTDEPQVLGFEPGNVPVSKGGKPIFTRLLEKRFLRPSETKMVNGARCTCGR